MDTNDCDCKIMSVLTTIRNLFHEAKRSFVYKDKHTYRVFYTLLSLYVKSKLSKKEDRVINHQIDSFTVYAYDYPTLINLYREIFLEAVYHFESTQTKPFIIDCGANIGMSVLFFKKCYPESEVWAFEPNPNSFSLLQKNIEVNQISNVKLFPFALSDADDTIEFFVPLKKGSLNGSSLEWNIKSEKISVEAQRLSKLIQGRTPACIKIDIEGDEEKVIWDLADNHLLDSVSCFAVEYHQPPDHSEHALPRFISYMKEAGFDHQQIKRDPSTEQKEIILHFNKKNTRADQINTGSVF